jgi:hypothetical protein
MTEELPHSDAGTSGKIPGGDCKQLLSGHEYNEPEDPAFSIDHSFNLLAEDFFFASRRRHTDSTAQLFFHKPVVLFFIVWKFI